MQTYRFNISDGSIETCGIQIEAESLSDAYFLAFEKWWDDNAESIDKWGAKIVRIEPQ